MPEFKLLYNVIDFMESEGSTYQEVSLSIDQGIVSEINIVNKTNYSLDELKRAADKCLAHEWLKHTSTGGGKYNHLQITPKGIGAARSRRKIDELNSARSFLKKTSDYIDDHKGLFIVLGFLLALATFTLNIFGKK